MDALGLQALHLLPIRRQLHLGALALGVLQLQALLDLGLLRHVLPASRRMEDPQKNLGKMVIFTQN